MSPKVSNKSFTRIEKPSIILLLLNNRKLPPDQTEQILVQAVNWENFIKNIGEEPFNCKM